MVRVTSPVKEKLYSSLLNGGNTFSKFNEHGPWVGPLILL